MLENHRFQEQIQSLHQARAKLDQEIKQAILDEYQRTLRDRTEKAYEVLKSEGVQIFKPTWTNGGNPGEDKNG